MNSRGAYRGDGSAVDAAILQAEIDAAKPARSRSTPDALSDIDATSEAAVKAMEAVEAALESFNGGPESAMDFVLAIARISGAYSIKATA